MSTETQIDSLVAGKRGLALEPQAPSACPLFPSMAHSQEWGQARPPAATEPVPILLPAKHVLPVADRKEGPCLALRIMQKQLAGTILIKASFPRQ